jgi:hypothetical protein
MKTFVALLAAVLAAQTPDPDTLLSRGRAAIRDAIRQLPRYTCTQTVDRTVLLQTRPGLDQRDCDQIVSNLQKGLARMEPYESDRLRLDVEVADAGIEVYSWPGSTRISTERIRDLVSDGPIGTGPFGPFLIDIFDNAGIQFVAEGESRIGDRTVRQYRFYVPQPSSHYRVRAGGDTRVVPYDGRFWLDSETADLARLVVRVGELSRSTETCEATTTVDFTRSRIAAGEYLLPRQSRLEIVRRDAAEQTNTTTYAGCREFLGESTVRFDEPAPEGASAGAAASRSTPIPPGLPVRIELQTEIDSDRSAAGDPVTGKILEPLVEKRSKRVLAPAGAVVHGRIGRLVHHLQGQPYFAISIVWEGLETGGNRVPFAALLDRPAAVLERKRLPDSRYDMVHEEARRSPQSGSTFVFPAGEEKYVMPSGSTAAWITAVPAKGN